MHERQVAAIAGRVEGGGGLGQMFTDDARFTDLLVAECQLIMREADGARIVRLFGMPERARVQCDGARLFTPRIREAPVQTPEGGELRVGQRVAQRIRRPAQRGSGLCDVILQEPRLGQGSPDGEFVLTRQRSDPQHRREQHRGLGSPASLERGVRASERGLHGCCRHDGSIAFRRWTFWERPAEDGRQSPIT